MQGRWRTQPGMPRPMDDPSGSQPTPLPPSTTAKRCLLCCLGSLVRSVVTSPESGRAISTLVFPNPIDFLVILLFLFPTHSPRRLRSVKRTVKLFPLLSHPSAGLVLTRSFIYSFFVLWLERNISPSLSHSFHSPFLCDFKDSLGQFPLDYPSSIDTGLSSRRPLLNASSLQLGSI